MIIYEVGDRVKIIKATVFDKPSMYRRARVGRITTIRRVFQQANTYGLEDINFRWDGGCLELVSPTARTLKSEYSPNLNYSIQSTNVDCASFEKAIADIESSGLKPAAYAGMSKIASMKTYGASPLTMGTALHEMLIKGKGEEKMIKKCIIAAYPATEDAVLVEKHLGHLIEDNIVGTLWLRTYNAEALAEAKRLEEEEVKAAKS